MTAVKKKSKNKASKVWYVSRFRQRYELSEDVRYDRKSPLLYTKDFVGSGSDDESCAYWRQLMALRSKPNWLILRGAFAELKNMAGNTSKTYRGYLLNSNFEPASEKEIGRWVGVDEKQAAQIIADLEDVGLLERVDLPDFDGDGDEQKKPKKKNKPPSKRARASTGSSKRARKSTGTTGRARKPLKKKANANAKTNAKAKKKPNDNIDTDNPNTEKNNNRQKSGRVNSNALEGKRKRKTKSATTDCRQAAVAPATTPPFMPQASDARGSRVIQLAQAPSGSVQNTRAEPQQIGEVIKEMEHRYDVDAQHFARKIYQALRLPWHIDSPDAARQLGSFASVLHKSKKRNLSQSSIEELWNQAHLEAGRIAKRKDKNRNPGAIWCKVFKRLLASKVSKQCKVM